jgi:hypothetical protein
MPSVSETVRPSTLKQIQTSIEGWFEAVFKGTDLPIRFSHPTAFPNRLCLVSSATPDFKVEVDQRTILLQAKRHRLLVLVDDFDVRTELQDKKICFQIEPHPKPENRVLDLALREVAETKHPALVSRLLRVVTNLEKELAKERINEAVAAPTDYLVFLNALTASSMASQSAAEDPLAAAKFRGLERKRQLVEAAGGALSAQNVADLLGITRQAVDKRRAQNQLIGLTQGRRGYIYPSFQFEDANTLLGLADVLEELRSFDPWMQLAFFVNSNDRLSGKTPVTALRAGNQSEVLRAARSYGEHGAS